MGGVGSGEEDRKFVIEKVAGYIKKSDKLCQQKKKLEKKVN